MEAQVVVLAVVPEEVEVEAEICITITGLNRREGVSPSVRPSACE